MRILTIFPDRIVNPVGGVGIQLAEIKKRLPNIEWDIIGLPDHDENGKKPDVGMVGVDNPFPALQHASLVTFGGQIAYFAEAIKHPKPDLVHAYDWSSYISGYYTAKHFGVPLVCTMQLSKILMSQIGINYADINTVDGSWLEVAHQEAEKMGLNGADKVIQVSNAYASKFKGLEEKTVVIPNGIALEDWVNKGEFNLSGDNPLKVVYIGRFATMKGINELLDADIPEGIDLVFIGKEEGGDGNTLKKMQEKGIKYIPFLSGQAKIDALFAADAVIVPSLHEPFGIVALEAFASKSILITSGVDGLSDFTNSQNSINCGTTPQTISTALKLFKSMTPEEKEKMIEAGLEKCKEYTWDSAAQKTLEVYQSLIK